jgi:hypothetical protein
MRFATLFYDTVSYMDVRFGTVILFLGNLFGLGVKVGRG